MYILAFVVFAIALFIWNKNKRYQKDIIDSASCDNFSPEKIHSAISGEYALPDEIRPNIEVKDNVSYQAYERELNERYADEKRKHEDSINSIKYPIVTNIDETLAYRLSPQERLFLWYINNKPISKPKIGTYWRVDYKIYDYNACINKLMRAGLLLISHHPTDYFSRITVKELKAIAVSNNIKCSGDKQKIISTLTEDLSYEVLSNISEKFPTFKITESGKNLIKHNYCLIYYHRNRNCYYASLNLGVVDSLMKKHPDQHPYKILKPYCVFKSDATAKKYLKEPRLF